MPHREATAVACANIAFIKYWGFRDEKLHLPLNNSISMNLAGIESITTVSLTNEHQDSLMIDGVPASQAALSRASHFMDYIRAIAGTDERVSIVSNNNFPMGSGIASSASAFAALAVAASSLFELEMTEQDLSRLARLGSGSACRSIPAGYTEWLAGDSDQTSYAISIASPENWDLRDCIAVVNTQPKVVGSLAGHRAAETSPLQEGRIASVLPRVEKCRSAIFNHDFWALADVIELDSNMMHAVMLTSTPMLFYWEPESILVMKSVQKWRKNGIPCAFTVDAGPNIHVICPAEAQNEVIHQLQQLPGIQNILTARPGQGARLLN